jgi:DNA-binding NarL/FixJ family response regulator
MGPARILVVDDYEPFRRLIRTMLDRPSLRIVGEASDGLEAIQKATLLQPDLILLDIGLPKLNGLKAAEQIRQLAPRCEILFLSQESSADVVQRALDLSALGYLHKTRTAELPTAIDSVLAGKRYVSTSLETREFSKPASTPLSDRHEVEFYSDDQHFLTTVSGFIAAALKAGNPAIVMATKSHREGLIQKLKDDGFDIDRSVRQGTYISLDAAELLSGVMVGDLPDGLRFFEGLSSLIKSASESASTPNPRIAICGECVGLLSAENNVKATIQLERAGNELLKTHNIEILCAYPLSLFQGNDSRSAFASVCKEHSAVHVR